jgi:hypothetical protein
MFRRRQFGDLIDHQLRVFAADHGDRLAAIRQARSAYRTSDRDEAEKRYGNYADELDWAAEELALMRDGYAETLDAGDGTADRYVAEFNRAVQRTMPEIAAALEG